MADRSTFFVNPFRSPPALVLSLRENLCAAGPSGRMRIRRYWEMPLRRLASALDREEAGGNSSGWRRRGYRPFVRDYFQCKERRDSEPQAEADAGAAAEVPVLTDSVDGAEDDGQVAETANSETGDEETAS